MQKNISIIFLFWLSVGLLSAQPTGQISMSDAILKGRTTLAPANLRSLAWIPGTDNFTHVVGIKLVRVAASNLATDTLDFLPKINEGLAILGSPVLKTLPQLTWLDADKMWFHTEKEVFVFSISKGLEKKNWYPAEAENLDYQDDTWNAAYTVGKELRVSIGGKEMKVASSEADGSGASSNDGIVYGKSVHREEYGIFKGTFWSESGQKLAFYRMDERQVTQYPILVLDSMPAQSKMIRYPFAGSKSHFVTIGVFDVKNGKTVYLKTEPVEKDETAEHYLTNVAWSPDDKYILVAIINRTTNHLWMKMFDAETGAFVRTIFEETNEKYVDPQQPAHFVPGTNDQFLWESDRDGFNHLYLYNTSGKLLGQASRGNFAVTNFYKFSADGKSCFFQTADESGLNRYLWKSDLKTGKMTKLTEEIGMHGGIFNLASGESSQFLDVFSNLTTPRKIFVASLKKPEKRQLVFEAKNPLEGLQIGQTSLVKMTSAGGQPLNGRLILPPNYDANKKYPTIIYVYNGPHVQMVANNWLAGGELWMHRMAQLGFAVFSVDGRGSANRGRDFENVIHRQCGTLEVEDQLTAAQYLKSQPFVDGSRMGVFGWSYGGFMATSLMTRPEAKGVFRCGVAGGPVIDWRMYEIMYTERYMDTPQENPEGYEKASLFNYIDNLDGRLLMIHGSSDDVVLWQNSLKYIEKCVQKGKQIDYFVYPEHLHNVMGKDRVHLFEKLERFFKDNLQVQTP